MRSFGAVGFLRVLPGPIKMRTGIYNIKRNFIIEILGSVLGGPRNDGGPLPQAGRGR